MISVEYRKKVVNPKGGEPLLVELTKVEIENNAVRYVSRATWESTGHYAETYEKTGSGYLHSTRTRFGFFLNGDKKLVNEKDVPDEVKKLFKGEHLTLQLDPSFFHEISVDYKTILRTA
jgi:hypothetical protein